MNEEAKRIFARARREEFLDGLVNELWTLAALLILPAFIAVGLIIAQYN